MMMIIYAVVVCLMNRIACEDIIWSSPLPCVNVPSISLKCGDCLELQLGEKLSNLSIVYSRCTQCDYYVTNDVVLSKLSKLDNIGDYGCTWTRYSFFTKHPFLFALCVSPIFIIIVTVLCIIRRLLTRLTKKKITLNILR